MKNINNSIPPDRSKVHTEQRNSSAMSLHNLSVDECVDVISSEDHQILIAIESAKPAIIAFIEEVEPRFAEGGRLIYVGAGTSGRLGVLDASEIPPTFQIPNNRIIGIIAGGDRSLRNSSEGLEDEPMGARVDLEKLMLTSLDTILGITAGGTTPYVLGSLQIAKDIHADVLTGLLCCSTSPQGTQADHLIYIPTGAEIITGSTRMKAGTATKLALNMISTTLMIRAGRVYQNLMVDLRVSNDKLRDRGARIIATLTELEREDCFDLLDKANGEVKAALVMHLNGLNYSDAVILLTQTNGNLDKALVS